MATTYVNKDGSLYLDGVRITDREEYVLIMEEIRKGRAVQEEYVPTQEDIDEETRETVKTDGIYYDRIKIPLTKENALALLLIKYSFDEVSISSTTFHVDTGDKITLTQVEFDELFNEFMTARSALFDT